MQVFFHNGPTARVSATHMQMSLLARLMEWHVWMANKTLFPRNASVYRVSVATFPHAADLGKQTYLLIGTAIKDIRRKVTLQGSSYVPLENLWLFGLEISQHVGFKEFDILTIARCGFISVSCTIYCHSGKKV